MINKNADIAFVGFDVTCRSSFTKTADFVDEIREYKENVIVVAYGTKIDLADQRVVTTEEARKHFEALNIPYFEVSSKLRIGVDELFEAALKLWIKQNQEKEDSEH